MSDDLALLFSERYQPMVRVAAWLIGDSGAAEDIVQDAFVKISRADVDLAALDSASAYLRTTVVNLTRTALRRSALGRSALSRAHTIEQKLVSPGPEAYLVDEQLLAAIAELSRRQRECVVLRYTEDLTVDQIASALGTSAGSVKTHLHRGLAALARTLEATDHREVR